MCTDVASACLTWEQHAAGDECLVSGLRGIANAPRQAFVTSKEPSSHPPSTATFLFGSAPRIKTRETELAEGKLPVCDRWTWEGKLCLLLSNQRLAASRVATDPEPVWKWSQDQSEKSLKSARIDSCRQWSCHFSALSSLFWRSLWTSGNCLHHVYRSKHTVAVHPTGQLALCLGTPLYRIKWLKDFRLDGVTHSLQICTQSWTMFCTISVGFSFR